MAAKYDGRFDELTGLVTKVVGRVDEIQLEMRDMRKEADETREEMRTNATSTAYRFDRLESALQFVSGRQEDVIPKVIEIQKDVNRISQTLVEQSSKMIALMNRLDSVDRRLNALDDRTARLDERTAQMVAEVKAIRKTMDSLIDPILDGKTLSANIRHLEERIARLEEKVT
jgi:chromosome segregation ATPase